jgi:hypothetical protein
MSHPADKDTYDFSTSPNKSRAVPPLFRHSRALISHLPSWLAVVMRRWVCCAAFKEKRLQKEEIAIACSFQVCLPLGIGPLTACKKRMITTNPQGNFGLKEKLLKRVYLNSNFIRQTLQRSVLAHLGNDKRSNKRLSFQTQHTWSFREPPTVATLQ